MLRESKVVLKSQWKPFLTNANMFDRRLTINTTVISPMELVNEKFCVLEEDGIPVKAVILCITCIVEIDLLWCYGLK